MTDTIATQRAEALAAEERWIACVARGREYDRHLRRRAVIGAVAIAAVVVLGLLFIR
jgi:hypothetical protein